MLRQGPISAFVHGVIEYLVGALFIAAPFVLGFDSDAAVAVSLVTGLVILVLTASTGLPTGLIRAVPMATHVVLDFLLGGFSIGAPFLFGFSDEAAPTAFFIVVGVAHVLVTIGTRFLPAEQRARARDAA